MKATFTENMKRDWGLTRVLWQSMVNEGQALLAEGQAMDPCTGEVDATGLAELIAWELGHDEWLDLDCHPVWDIAADLAGEGQ